MKRFTAWLAAGTAAAAFLCAGGLRAATPTPVSVTIEFDDTVVPAQMEAYEAGIKSLTKCVGQHGYKYAVFALRHVTGDSGQYSYGITVPNWAGLDTLHAAGMADCDSVNNSDVAPHVQSSFTALEQLMPGFSRLPKDQSDLSAYPLVDVIHFWLKPGPTAHDAFENGVKEIYAAEAKTNWPGYSQMSEIVAAGPDAPDYELVIFNKNWAQFGMEPNPPLWKMVANAYGQQKADAIRKSLNGAILKTEEHVDRVAPDLSYTPSKN